MCGYANNKDLSDKVLNLEIMKNLSIDKIIDLYRQGYILGGINVDPGLDIPKMSIINTLTYNNQCSGTPELAFNNTSVLQGTFGAVRKGMVWAQRFYGNFRCLDTVQFNMRRIANVNFYIEIRRDDGVGEGKPLGVPLVDDSGLILRTSSMPYTDIPTSPNWVYPTVLTILPTDSYYWICFVPVDFYDSSIYRDIAYDRFWLQDGTNIADKRSAVFQNGGWTNSSTFAFAIFKLPAFSNCTTMGNVAASPTTAVIGDSISLSAQASPAGIYTVQFYDTITNIVLATDTATVAKTAYSALWISSTVGVYQIKARVVGQCESPGMTTVTINCTPSVSGVTANPTTVNVGQPVTLTSMVTPSGIYTIQFIKTDGTVLASDTSSTSKMTYSAIWIPSVVGTYDIRAKTSTQSLSCANQLVETVTVNPAPANIIATAMTATPSTPCLEGTCTVNVSVTWQNTGGTIGSFVPNISIDTTPISPAPYPSEMVGSGSSTTHTFVVTGLTKVGSPHAICPYPN